MALTRPAQGAGRRTQLTVLVVGFTSVALLFAATALAASRHRPNVKGPAYLSAGRRSRHGQAGYALGTTQPVTNPNEQPALVASLANVMTAYLVLKSHLPSGAQDGFTVTVTAAQAEAQDAGQDQSVVAVRAGGRDDDGPPGLVDDGRRHLDDVNEKRARPAPPTCE